MRIARALVAVVAVVASLSLAPTATAVSGPTVSVDRNVVHIGDQILVTLQGWPDQRAVDISLCGNLAARGSIDCDLTNSLGYGVSGAQPVQAVLFRITAPPMPCPCVIQVTNTTQSETTYAPITILEFPTAPVVGNTLTSPLMVSTTVKRANGDLWAWVRSSLGGPTAYELNVVVKNRTAEDVTGVRLTARAGRNATDQARIIKIKAPEVIPSGQSWEHT